MSLQVIVGPAAVGATFLPSVDCIVDLDKFEQNA